MAPPYRVHWRGPIQRKGGLGNSSREYVKALRRQGVPVTTASFREAARNPSGKREPKRVLIYHYPPHTLQVIRERRRYDRIILNTVWETTQIPRSWKTAINQYNGVFVPTRHNYRALRKSGVRVPIHIVPHGVDTKAFSPSNPPYRLPSAAGKFVFVSVFGFQHRKNPEALLRAYWEAFSHKDRVLLVIKTNGYSARENGAWIRRRIERYRASLRIPHRPAPYVVLTGYMGSKALKGLYTLGDVFVLPTRGEGVGMPYMEAMASGIPVIATSWGGQMDFLTSANSFLVPYRLQSPSSSMKKRSAISKSFRSLFAGPGQQWAEVDLAGLKAQLRKAYLHPGLCRSKGKRARQDALRLSWGHAGREMRKALEKVMAEGRASGFRKKDGS
ncbi:glycosyltransferase family 4 protein [Cohnella nanjingensis]|uniref:Glycosyltransferase family 4 protein n=1 Tax=Cohnella nanjingensis TaxID=1387779 RepID=A0A7X0VFC7_9BACL|nr:glycosyltransferase family 4 protein [Cohnella nanjingensis]MBB6671920.1 glycosyltransferase family 4 protein [Cohnella nanjingensis]